METETNLEADRAANHQSVPLQEWPAIVIEKASHGSMIDFLTSPTPKVPISLKAKVRHCADVMNCLLVSPGFNFMVFTEDTRVYTPVVSVMETLNARTFWFLMAPIQPQKAG